VRIGSNEAKVPGSVIESMAQNSLIRFGVNISTITLPKNIFTTPCGTGCGKNSGQLW
jgi:hypothetical protein